MVFAIAFAAVRVLPGGAGVATARANVVTYADPQGDPAGAAADITAVRAENDDAGLFTLRVTLANRPQLQTTDRLTVFLDTDRDDRSGQNGADFFFVLSRTATSTGADLCRWNGTTADCTTPRTTFRAAFSTTLQQVLFSVNRSELGNTTGIGFSIRTYFGPDTSQTDRAPNVGSPEYIFPFVLSPVTSATTTTTVGDTVVSTAPEGISLGAVGLAPRKPKAGKTLSATVTVRGRADGAPVRPESVSCRGKIGKAAAPLVVKRAASGTASCTWRLPRSAKGKRFTGTIGATGAGDSVARSFSAAIR